MRIVPKAFKRISATNTFIFHACTEQSYFHSTVESKQTKIFVCPLLFPRGWFLVFRESCTSCLVHNTSWIDAFMYNKNILCCSHHSFPTHAPHCSVDSVPGSPASLPGASPLPWRETERGIILLQQIKAGYRWVWTGAAWFTGLQEQST